MSSDRVQTLARSLAPSSYKPEECLYYLQAAVFEVLAEVSAGPHVKNDRILRARQKLAGLRQTIDHVNLVFGPLLSQFAQANRIRNAGGLVRYGQKNAPSACEAALNRADELLMSIGCFPNGISTENLRSVYQLVKAAYREVNRFKEEGAKEVSIMNQRRERAADAQRRLRELWRACELYHKALLWSLDFKYPRRVSDDRPRLAPFVLDRHDLKMLGIENFGELMRHDWAEITTIVTLMRAEKPHHLGSVRLTDVVWTPAGDQEPDVVSVESISAAGPAKGRIPFGPTAVIERVEFRRDPACLPWLLICESVRVRFSRAEELLDEHQSQLRHPPLFEHIQSDTELLAWWRNSELGIEQAEAKVKEHLRHCQAEIDRVLRRTSWEAEISDTPNEIPAGVPPPVAIHQPRNEQPADWPTDPPPEGSKYKYGPIEGTIKSFAEALGIDKTTLRKHNAKTSWYVRLVHGRKYELWHESEKVLSKVSGAMVKPKKVAQRRRKATKGDKSR